MTAAKRCNRCGEYYGLSDLNCLELKTIKTTAPSRGIATLDGTQQHEGEIDLCPKCTEKFYEWMSNR